MINARTREEASKFPHKLSIQIELPISTSSLPELLQSVPSDLDQIMSKQELQLFTSGCENVILQYACAGTLEFKKNKDCVFLDRYNNPIREIEYSLRQ
jgi:hypothetical protein